MEKKATSTTSNKLFQIKEEAAAAVSATTGISSNEELLLLEAPKETDQVFKTLGINSKKDFVREEMRDTTIIKTYEDLYNGYEAFTGKHIKKLCNKYCLQILTAESIQGYISSAGAEAILEFKKKFEESQKVSLITSCFYILAPREAFKSKSRGKELKTFIILFRKHYHEREYGMIRKSDTLLQLYSSGNDFSEGRTIYKYLSKERFTSGDGMPRLYGNIILSILFLGAISCAIVGAFIGSISLFILYIILLLLYNYELKSDTYWNKQTTFS